jgi:hypothetical protein
VVHTHNPSYVEGGDEKMLVSGQPRQQVSKTLSQKQVGYGGTHLRPVPGKMQEILPEK